MRQMRKLVLLKFVVALLALWTAGRAWGQSVYTPAAGTPERKQIMDALRVPCEKDLKQKVIFQVSLLKISGVWAAARVTPVRPDGSPINYRLTKYKEDFENGAFDSGGEALLQKKDGVWKLLHWRFGATDTELFDWIEKHGAPKIIGEME